MTGVILRQSVNIVSSQVAEEVTAAYKLGNEVCVLILSKLFNEVHDIGAMLAGEHSVAL